MTHSFAISAIVPTYNRQTTIQKALNSILAQKCLPCEIIVIDDGSTDETQQLVLRYGQKVRYISQTNRGVSAARNRGVKEATGEWIAFLDSDDYWENHHLERMADAIEGTAGRACLYFADIRWPSEQGGELYWDICKFKINGKYEIAEDPRKWALMKTQPMMLQASVIRRKSYMEVGGLPEHMPTREDTLLFHKLCLFGAVCAVAGCGTVMTADGREEARLTARYDSGTVVFWDSTKLLYKELLKITYGVSEDWRREMLCRLVMSYLGKSRYHFRQKQFFAMASDLLSGVSVNPWLCAKGIREMLKGYIVKSTK